MSGVQVVHAEAQRGYDARICLLPTANDGSKAPALPTWMKFKTERPSPDEWRSFQWSSREGLGMIAGRASDCREVWDFDCPETYEAFKQAAEQSGLGEVVRRIEAGYSEATPSGGRHWIVQYPESVEWHDVTLARRPGRDDEPKVKTLIELPTHTILAPSGGTVHPSGRSYVRLSGGFDTIASYNIEERDELMALARSFDQILRAEHPAPAHAASGVATRPGDDFNRRATWDEVLEPHGWRRVYTRGETATWRRPGKTHGISATTNHAGSDLFYVFSSSTEFEPERGYSKFSVFAQLEHRGDFNAAAKALAGRGYGTESRRPPQGRAVVSPESSVEGHEQEALILDPGDPLPSARAFVAQSYTVNEIIALRHHAGVFYAHRPDVSAYCELEEAAVRADLWAFLESAQRWSEPKGQQPAILGPFKPTKSRVENVLDALRATCNLPAAHGAPSWLQDDPGLDPFDILACRSGLLHIPSRRLLPATPHFFTLNGLDFAYEEGAPSPGAWLRFLDELWPEDPASSGTLQEFIGYLLTSKTHFQKMLMLVGPKRSGKGTIGRVVRQLLGVRNVCSPTLANMGEQFGLSTLIGKSVGIISDARISGRTDTAIVTERLLSISGEDPQTIPRKFLPDWNGRLLTRFMLMTNELPRIEDASGALPSRFLVLRLTRSFYGCEDHELEHRLMQELPGILNWALDGWDRLSGRGRFVQPESSAEMIREFEDLGSPIGAFLRECCEVDKGHEVAVERLFSAWTAWSEKNGRERPGTSQTFGRNLRAAIPWLGESQPRVLGHRVRYYQGVRLRDAHD